MLIAARDLIGNDVLVTIVSGETISTQKESA
jgi:hypothetical protein